MLAICQESGEPDAHVVGTAFGDSNHILTSAFALRQGDGYSFVEYQQHGYLLFIEK